MPCPPLNSYNCSRALIKVVTRQQVHAVWEQKQVPVRSWLQVPLTSDMTRNSFLSPSKWTAELSTWDKDLYFGIGIGIDHFMNDLPRLINSMHQQFRSILIADTFIQITAIYRNICWKSRSQSKLFYQKQNSWIWCQECMMLKVLHCNKVDVCVICGK